MASYYIMIPLRIHLELYNLTVCDIYTATVVVTVIISSISPSFSIVIIFYVHNMSTIIPPHVNCCVCSKPIWCKTFNFW